MLRKQLDNIIQPFDTTQQQSFFMSFSGKSTQHATFLPTYYYFFKAALNKSNNMAVVQPSFTWAKWNL